MPSLHRVSTDALIGMMKVTEHYTHTFEKLRFHFQFQSEPTFDQTSWYVTRSEVSLKLHYPLMSYSKTVVFKILLLVVY